LCITLFAGIAYCWSQPAVMAKLSLDQAIRIAQEQSLRKQSVDALYESGFWQYKSINASRFTSINLTGDLPNLNRSIGPVLQPDGTIAYKPVFIGSSSVALQLNQPIMPIGGNIWVSSGLTRNDIFSSDTAFWLSSPFQVGVSIPLAGFNRRRWEWRQAKIRYTQNTSIYAEELENLSINVTQLYFDLYIANMEYGNAIQNETINDSIFVISQGRYNVGKIAENELLQVELSLMNARNNVSQTRVRKEIAEERLKILLGLNRNENVILDTLPPMRVLDVDVAKAIQEAKDNSSFILQNKLDINNALMNMRESGRNRFIGGEVAASFGLNQTAPTLGGAYTDLRNFQTANLSFFLPIYNFGRAQSEYRMNKAMYESVVAETELAVMNMEIDIKQRVLELKQLESAVIISAKANDIAARRYDVSKNRFLIGKIDITNLTIAQNEKDIALISYIRTLRDYWVAFYQLRRATLYDFEQNEKLIVQPEKKR